VQQRGRRSWRPRGSRWQVQRERCRLDAGATQPPAADAQPLGDVVARVMKNLGLEDEHWLGQLVQHWPELVGTPLSHHTRPGRVEAGVLYVFVDSSPWLSELKRYSGPKLLANVQERFGPKRVRRIVFALDPDPGATRSPH
jgi:predicted nucleic acid-binding Zn ribbon protein